MKDLTANVATSLDPCRKHQVLGNEKLFTNFFDSIIYLIIRKIVLGELKIGRSRIFAVY
jgi:hypothetical protein